MSPLPNHSLCRYEVLTCWWLWQDADPPRTAFIFLPQAWRKHNKEVSRALQLCLTVKLQNCSVNYDTSPDFPSALRREWLNLTFWLNCSFKSLAAELNLHRGTQSFSETLTRTHFTTTMKANRSRHSTGDKTRRLSEPLQTQRRKTISSCCKSHSTGSNYSNRLLVEGGGYIGTGFSTEATM